MKSFSVKHYWIKYFDTDKKKRYFIGGLIVWIVLFIGVCFENALPKTNNGVLISYYYINSAIGPMGNSDMIYQSFSLNKDTVIDDVSFLIGTCGVTEYGDGTISVSILDVNNNNVAEKTCVLGTVSDNSNFNVKFNEPVSLKKGNYVFEISFSNLQDPISFWITDESLGQLTHFDQTCSGSLCYRICGYEQTSISVNCFMLISSLLFVVYSIMIIQHDKIINMLREKLNFLGKTPSRFILIALILGLMFSYMVIPWQAPDEGTHLAMIGNGMGNENLDDILIADLPLDQARIWFNSDQKINFSDLQSAMNKTPDYRTVDCLPKGISFTIVKHLPATIGVLTGVVLHLPTYWVLQLGELFALIFYIAVCSYALKIMPFKKDILELIMLLPMCIQQAASLNYDAVLLPLCFLFVAYVMKLKFSDSDINIKGVVMLLLLLLYISYVKMPYILLGMLIFTIPLNKFEFNVGKHTIKLKSNNKSRFMIGTIMVVLVATSVIVFKNNEYFSVCVASVLEFKRIIWLFGQTIKERGEDLIVSLIGNFGWLDTPMSCWSVAGIIAFVTVIAMSNIKYENDSEKIDKPFNKWDRVVILGCVICMVYSISLSLIRCTVMVVLYGSESIVADVNYREAVYQISYIMGLQGRYYIPILAPLLLIAPNIFEVKSKKYRILYCFAIIILGFYTFQVLRMRYFY